MPSILEQAEVKLKDDVRQRAATFKEESLAPAVIQDRLYKMIDYAVKRFDWYEEQRFKFLQIALAMITVTAGLSGFLANVRTSMTKTALVISFVAIGVLLITGIKLLFLYNALRGITYPYRKIADIRSWFFKYNFDKLPAALSQDATEASAQIAEVATAYENFTSRWAEYATTDRAFIEEDLQQVFILQLLQAYRRDNLESMHKVLEYGVVIFVGAAALAVFIFFLS